MNIGIFGGAFNPVHNGHIALANNYLSALRLDKIIFIPTAVSPHKSSENLISGQDRINMLSLALKGNERFEISDIEFKREGKSYSYDTICQLKELYPGDKFYFIVGADQFLYFKKWYRADDILKMVTLCTAAREENELGALLDFRDKNADMSESIVSSFDAVVVSSSQVRQALKDGADISTLVPSEVEKYIRENNIYV